MNEIIINKIFKDVPVEIWTNDNYHYQGYIIEKNIHGLWLDDRYKGEMYIEFSIIKTINFKRDGN